MRAKFPGKPALQLLCTGVFIALAAPAHALVITPNFIGNYDASQQATVYNAIAIYESLLSDNVNIKIDFNSMSTGLGSSSDAFYSQSYSQLYAAMAADSTSANDFTAVSHLSSGSADAFTGASQIGITYAQCGALGLNCGAPTNADGSVGTVGINLGSVDSNRSDGIPFDKFDMMAVVMHEIDEILGIGGWGSGLGADYVATLDLFRYGAAGNRTYTTSGDDAYFSIDGGATDVARFNQEAIGDKGDWWSACDFSNS